MILKISKLRLSQKTNKTKTFDTLATKISRKKLFSKRLKQTGLPQNWKTV